jgi:hypothetical protein
MTMIEPNTGNATLDRMLVWYRLIKQIGETYDHRDSDVRSSIGDATFNMGNVTVGYSIVADDYCLTACCALGAAACHPWFNSLGLRPAFAPSSELKLDGLHVRLGYRTLVYRSELMAQFFGLSKDLYVRIVDPEFYDTIRITPALVADRIRHAIRQTFSVDPVSHPFIERLVA